MNAVDTIEAKSITLENGCWHWTGWRTPVGYGRIRVAGQLWLTHRYMYETLCGPIPDGLSLDHQCRNPSCVNPAHLEPVTHAENVRRGRSGQFQRNKTHCPHGHAYSSENTGVYSGRRQCMTCNRKRAYARWVRLRYEH